MVSGVLLVSTNASLIFRPTSFSSPRIQTCPKIYQLTSMGIKNRSFNSGRIGDLLHGLLSNVWVMCIFVLLGILSHGSEKFTFPHYSTDISTSNTALLWCWIYREMEVYQQIILKALNLDDEQKRVTLNDLLSRCLIIPKEKDVLKHPFSWKTFRQGGMCEKSS